MKTTLLATTAALALSASLAFAGPFNDQVIADLQGQGFSRIEVRNGPTQTKFEAIRGDTVVEIIYDNVTGAIIDQETQVADSDEDRTPGVFERTEDRDFRDDDDSGADDDDMDDSGNDDLDDDEGSDDDGSDNDDVGDDDGSDDDEGGDDDGSDVDQGFDDDEDDDASGHDDDTDNDENDDGGIGGDESDDD